MDGNLAVDLNGSRAGGIHRIVPVRPGAPHVLTMRVAENTACGPAVKQFEVVWDGIVVRVVDVDTGGSLRNPDWRELEVELPAPLGPTAQLALRAVTPGSCGALVDDVAVRAR
jgi:hypothetical protein